MPTPRSGVNTSVELTLMTFPTIRENDGLIRDYIRYRVNNDGWRPRTIQMRRLQLHRIAEQLPAPLHAASEEHLHDWLSQRDGRPGTRASDISALHGLYDWMATLSRPRLRADNPAAALRRPKIPPYPPRPMPNPDLDKALAHAVHDLELFIWLILMSCCGLRCCELAWLRVPDVELRDDGSARMHLTGKGGKRRVVFADAELVDLMRPFLRGQATVFTRPSDGQPYRNGDAVSKRMNTYLNGLGITARAHQGRHRFGGDFHEINPDLLVQARAMGHASTRTTEGYTETDVAAAAPAIAELTRRRMRHARRAS